MTPAPAHGSSAGWSPQRKLRLARAALLALAALVVLGLVTSLVRGLGGGSDQAAQGTSSGQPTSASTTPAASSASTSPSAMPTPTPSLVDESADQVAPVPVSAVPTRGAGTFTPVDVPGAASTAKGRVVRYSVEVENGVKVDGAAFARTVHDVLLDPRGWQTQDGVRFENLSPKQLAAGQTPTIRILLATPTTVDTLCAPLRTLGRVSCHNGGKVVVNLVRWEAGAPSYGNDLARYRLYLVNHEVGHSIGHGHAQCPAPGRPAPVMLQQTLGLQGCLANTWPTVTKG